MRFHGMQLVAQRPERFHGMQSVAQRPEGKGYLTPNNFVGTPFNEFDRDISQ